ncbi:alpha-1,3-mannosyl-glycoprotein 2-beta-N-acetylglucosaminyltransferase isoform X1 [Chiroxiphia lanceolata]|uniref:alpha-1,3-mannosyl-glycoprotein 2-beta-N-acetylglucosaminyltransferase isoform X1 n=1 Tax=Chiroxiphia lanceolata TaxID=296741 RepID=UPI0013CEE38C|nr:alpha-1,3-mannosyl-glycoprotein 2-beta-N-acetylglucosaminyltransferase isoform X1 [Chiroxiphia lanceolata]XP_032533396.1 alpha-1,3-mannosyl-glycoprotein 2-beta-N-acetylglucosaminyltransferase isoform X1 [Chiroxiphia lanceolata]XP_032533397.1 alpha-1,3-mannosyl-glycoprotein 2-beta-N-acetylglucosaminyltransferase isoform X1 [Chiroxiphia lanceolata]XP_032533398.1 alpha-1,3-mannosyl-glycoprotein 2-beta-N-acetylglucosaminyltransferase isoform X1 [Chiroxiphia lanceolata]
MPKKSSWALWGAALFLAWNGLLLLFLWSRPPSPAPGSGGSSSRLPSELIRLAQDAEAELERQKELLRQIHRLSGLWELRRRRQKAPTTPPARGSLAAAPSSEEEAAALPVLVLACDRSTVRRCLDKLLRYRPSARRHPVIVSQDCGHAETARVIASYGDAVAHIRQPDLSDIPVPPEHRKFQGYYRIARHYRWALGQVFRVFRYRAAIVVEDDLEVAPDFFEYFEAALPLLRDDRTLWCVSAWNDNGREQMVDVSQAELLYRTDFFPGLGWLLLAELWDELEPKWPRAFWDDWMRQPEQRRGRSCVRPEVSRTMTFGRKGVSHGQFFDQYLKFIKLNDRFVPFTRLDLSYLKKDEYERSFLPRVYSAPEVRVEELQGNRRRDLGAVRLQYSGRDAFKAFAKALGLMDDLKSGVPRAGYRGIVSFVYRGRRVYLAPPRDWTGYDPTWS